MLSAYEQKNISVSSFHEKIVIIRLLFGVSDVPCSWLVISRDPVKLRNAAFSIHNLSHDSFVSIINLTQRCIFLFSREINVLNIRFFRVFRGSISFSLTGSA